jgi:two-component system sensor histidine kinase EvgS
MILWQLLKRSSLLVWFFGICFASGTVELTPEERSWVVSHPVVRVGGGPDWAPVDFVKDGKYGGIANDYLQLLSQKTGLHFKVEVDQWKHNLQKIKEGRIDLLHAVYHTSRREAFLSYTRPYFELLDYFFIRDDLKVSTLEDLNGKTVAMPRGYAHEEILRKAFPKIRILYVDTFSHAIDAVLTHKADMLFDTYASLNYVLRMAGIQTIIPFKAYRGSYSMKIHMASSKKEPLLASIVDKGLAAINDAEKAKIREKWLGRDHHASLVLSHKEKQWILTHPSVSVGVDRAWAPFDFVNENGKHDGLSEAYLQYIAKKTGLHFDIADIPQWHEVLDAAKERKIDMILALSYSPERTRVFDFSDLYIDYTFAMVTRNSGTFFHRLEDFNGKRVGVVASYLSETLLRQNYPQIKRIVYKDIDAMLEGLLSHEVDAVFDNAATLAYHIRKKAYGNMQMTAVGKRYHAGVALAKGNHPILLSLVNKALRSMSEAEKKAIRDRWISFDYTPQTDYTLLFQVIVLFLLIVLGTLYWMRKLSVEVEKRKRSEAQIRLLIESIPLQIYVTTLEGRVLMANPYALNRYGVSLDVLQSANVLDYYLHASDRERILEMLQHQGEVSGEVIQVRGPHDEVCDLLLSIIPIEYEGRQRLLSIAVDLTERIQMEKALEEVKEEAQRANAAKSRFLANISHEIRTPITAIAGYTDLLASEIRTQKASQYLQTIRRSGALLLSLINDLLDVSVIEAEKVVLHPEPVDLVALCHEIETLFALRFKEKGLDLILDIDGRIPAVLTLDALRVRQVLLNLVGNALKFTAEGKITLRLEMLEEKSGIYDIRFTVEDTGIGIRKDQISKIFKSFEQQEGQDNKQYGGTGLGLYISRRFAEAMGGTLTAESEEGQGSRFYFCLYGVPAAQETSTMLPSVTAPDIPTEYHTRIDLSKEHLSPDIRLELIGLFDLPGLFTNIGTLQTFSEQLQAFSKTHGLSQFSHYATLLREAGERFDIREIKVLQQAYEAWVQQQ